MRRRLPFVTMVVTVALVFVGCAADESGEAVTTVASAANTTAGIPATTSTVEIEPVAEPEPPPVPAEESSENTVGGSVLSSENEVDELYPLRVRVSGTDIDASIIDLGLNDDGSMEIPKDFSVTGWYTGRPPPGELGPSIIVGHVDNKQGPAVFYELRNLAVGDLIEVDRSDGLIAWFKVREVALVDKLAFPTDKVYGTTEGPELRLITCGGSFDSDARSYRNNVIVFADHLGNFEPMTPVDTAT
ncbi:MAG: class F sortase [bacterium]|nr:class F sortase [bacterium]